MTKRLYALVLVVFAALFINPLLHGQCKHFAFNPFLNGGKGGMDCVSISVAAGTDGVTGANTLGTANRLTTVSGVGEIVQVDTSLASGVFSRAGALGLSATGSNSVSLTTNGVDRLKFDGDGSGTIQGTLNYCADAGASDTYACNLSPAITAYVAGNRYTFKANTANTGAATVNFNGVGAVAIKTASGADPATGDIRAGQVIDVVYTAGSVMQIQSAPGHAKSDPLSVLDYGARGDWDWAGSTGTDDTAAIQAAIDAAVAAERPLYVPAVQQSTGKCYKVTGLTIPYSAVGFRMFGAGYASALCNTGTGVTLTVGTAYPSANTGRKVEIDHLLFMGGDATGYAIKLQQITDAKIHDNYFFHSSTTGVYWQEQGWGSRIVNNSFSNVKGTAISLTSAENGVLVSGNFISGASTAAGLCYFVDGSYDVRFFSNTCQNIGQIANLLTGSNITIQGYHEDYATGIHAGTYAMKGLVINGYFSPGGFADYSVVLAANAYQSRVTDCYFSGTHTGGAPISVTTAVVIADNNSHSDADLTVGTGVLFDVKRYVPGKLMLSGTTATGDQMRVSSSGSPGYQWLSTDTTSTERNWGAFTSMTAYGTFDIRQSNARGGDPFSAGTTKLSLAADSALTGRAACWNGVKLSYCTSVVAADGSCTCN